MDEHDANADRSRSASGTSGDDPNSELLELPPEDAEVGRFEYDPSVLTPSAAVVEAVATQVGRSSVEIDPLFSAVDPEALDAVFSRTGVQSVSLAYEGYQVTVDRNARISLRTTDSG